ncbi:hypothetical protein ABPG77_002537 [Micractinium sp. CCAP 211/92]
MNLPAASASLPLPAPLGGTVLVRDCLEAEAGFLIVQLIKAMLVGYPGAPSPPTLLPPSSPSPQPAAGSRRVVLLAAAQSASHYAAVLRKAGLSLPALVGAGQLAVVELLPALAAPAGLPSLRDVHARLAAALACQAGAGSGENSSTCLVVDDLTALHCLADGPTDWAAFLHACLAAGQAPGGAFVGLAHSGVPDDEFWLARLEHAAAVVIDVEPLESGRSADLTGRLTVTHRAAIMRSHSRLLPGATTLALALACAALALLPRASAHGFVAEPAARNLVRNWQYCPHCVNSGGPWVVSKGGKLTWPAYSAPVCGDRDLEQAGAPVARYTAGGDIDITLFITALHGGRHQFRLCPSEDVTEACLDQNMLERADGSGPYSWTPVNGGSAPGAKWRKDVKAGQGGQSYTWRYRLPKGVTCKRCVLQWFWTTANSCRVPGAPSWIGSDPGMLSCTQQGPYPETFINCADISISGGSSSERDSPSGERRSERAGSQSTQPDNAGHGMPSAAV